MAEKTILKIEGLGVRTVYHLRRAKETEEGCRKKCQQQKTTLLSTLQVKVKDHSSMSNPLTCPSCPMSPYPQFTRPFTMTLGLKSLREALKTLVKEKRSKRRLKL